MAELTTAGPRTEAAAGTREGSVRRGRPRGQRLNFWIFVGPFLAGLLLFVYVPIGWSLYLSFFQAQSTVPPTKFVGLGNFADLLRGGPVVSSLSTVTLFAAFIVPLPFGLARAL